MLASKLSLATLSVANELPHQDSAGVARPEVGRACESLEIYATNSTPNAIALSAPPSPLVYSSLPHALTKSSGACHFISSSNRLIPRPLLLPRRRRGEKISRFNSPHCKITTNRTEQKPHFESAIQYQFLNSSGLRLRLKRKRCYGFTAAHSFERSSDALRTEGFGASPL